LTDVALVGLAIADPPERWQALGFAVQDGQVTVGAVVITLGIAPQGAGITGWTLACAEGDGDVGGLATRWVPAASGVHPPAPAAASEIASVDHVVVVTPRFDALADELDQRGFPLRRVAEIRGKRMGFRRLGGPILEVVEAREAEATALWGITFGMSGAPGASGSLDELRARRAAIGEPRPAVQPGRRISPVGAEAGLSTRVAFIDPEPR
jgi:hypothetical protein